MLKRSLSLLMMLLILCCALGSYADQGEDYALPLDMDFACYEPNPSCFTADGYQDESLTVRTEHRKENGVIFDLIWFTVKHPSQLRTLTAGTPNEPQIELVSRMSRYVHAVAAINGEYYLQRDRGILVYRQGVLYRNEPDPRKDILVIDSAGDFHVFCSEDKEQELAAYTEAGGDIVNAFSFGPALVRDGEAVQVRPDYFFNADQRLPRSVIAQVGPLSYVFVVAEGKKKDSKGCTHQEMADFMAGLQVQTAYNLDGGQSTVLMFNSTYFLDFYREMEREQSDMVFVTTAVDPKTWRK
ncbi:MAG: phosphodiester glycosidase family protein [Clostridia bacterium]|nr:phosphodiester glycosidase family protein [Clostridia bacterium]